MVGRTQSHLCSGQGRVSCSVQAVVKGISRGSIGRKRAISPGRPPPSLGSCGEGRYLEPHKDLHGGWLPLHDNCQRGAWNRTESACCPIFFFCFTSFPFNNLSWACVGFRFGLTLVLAEPVHLFRLRGCPNNIWAYFACVWLSFPFFLQGKCISVESVALIQRKQHGRVAALAELSG